MKTEKFSTDSKVMNKLIRQVARNEFNEYIDSFTTQYAELKRNSYPAELTFFFNYSYDYDKLSDKTKKELKKLAKEEHDKQQEELKKRYLEIKKICDEVFYDDNQYKKLVQELDYLYYCQAYQVLSDFKHKKQKSKALSNSKYQARLMKYSKVNCA